MKRIRPGSASRFGMSSKNRTREEVEAAVLVRLAQRARHRHREDGERERADDEPGARTLHSTPPPPSFGSSYAGRPIPYRRERSRSRSVVTRPAPAASGRAAPAAESPTYTAAPASGGRRVELAAVEDDRDLPAEDVAQHPAGRRGRGAHEDDDDPRVRHGLRDLRPAHREEREADGVRREEAVLLRHPSAREEDRPHRGGGDHGEVLRLAHPEHREPAEEEVPERAAADRGDDGDDEHPEQVEALAPAGERTAHREDENAREVEGLEKSLRNDGGSFTRSARPILTGSASSRRRDGDRRTSTSSGAARERPTARRP